MKTGRIAGAMGFAIALGVASGEVTTGDVFYVDPLQGSMENDGSAERPWRTLQEVFDNGLIETRRIATYPWQEGVGLVTKNEGAPVGPGDTLVLRSGYHGEIDFRGGDNAETITIEAAEGALPLLKRVRLTSVRRWLFRGLVVSPSEAPEYSAGSLFEIDSHGYHGPSSDVTVEHCQLYSVKNASAWTIDDWNSLACSGIGADGDRCVIRGNHLLNVNFGITVGGDHSLVAHNTVENFAGDGLRGLGDHGVFEFNTVKNCYDVNGNHDDGFQSWSSGEGGVGTGVVRGLVLRGNVIINHTDEDQPFRGTLQGIGCFDGFFEDWVVENNVIVVDHWHGLSLYGARNCRVLNNTVIDINDERPGPPWIRVGAHKDGSPSTGCTVRNNLATSFSIGSDPSMVVDHNLTVGEPEEVFVDPAGHDLRLKEGSAAIDAGTGDGATIVDARGVPRPQGEAVDAGAFEREVDDDGNGLPDWWEDAHLDDAEPGDAGPGGDLDGDGASNGDEYRSGTDPADPSSALRMRSIRKEGAVVWLEWPSEPARSYGIERSTMAFDESWEPVATGIPATTPLNRWWAPSAGETGFYRVVVKP